MRKLTLLLKLTFTGWRESFFLAIANGLPRSELADAIRARLLRLSGMRINHRTLVFAPVEVRPIGGAKRIQIGGGFINAGVRFACAEPATITIGKGVRIGPRCTFETANHSLEHLEDGSRPATAQSIVVEDNVWLGASVTVLPGVTLGEGSVVAAGAVVSKDVQPYTVVGGTPAKRLKDIEPHRETRQGP